LKDPVNCDPVFLKRRDPHLRIVQTITGQNTVHASINRPEPMALVPTRRTFLYIIEIHLFHLLDPAAMTLSYLVVPKLGLTGVLPYCIVACIFVACALWVFMRSPSANAFETSDIQEVETEDAQTKRSGCNNVALR
jgi:hypothetical protein